ncbi:MAG: SDR family NAD(P)-dependent oxidoreductase [Deltaproteobacteria bacterium]
MAAVWRNAFISGAASGMGRRLAEKLLERGTDIAVFDLATDEEPRADLLRRAQARGAKCTFHTVDIRDAAALATSVPPVTRSALS